MDFSFLKSDYVILGLVVGTFNWIICEVLRRSSCRYNSVGHFVFSDMSMCGHNVTVDVHFHEHNEENAPLLPSVHIDAGNCHVDI